MAEAIARPSPATRTVAATASIALAVAAVAPLTEGFEHYAPRVYLDPAHIPSYCYGETKDPDPTRIYAQTYCAKLMRDRMARDYAPKLVSCMPAILADRFRSILGAVTDTAYNAGPDRVCRRVAPLFNSGFYRDACEAIRGFLVSARDRKTRKLVKLRGLVRRRNAIADFCLKGL